MRTTRHYSLVSITCHRLVLFALIFLIHALYWHPHGLRTRTIMADDDDDDDDVDDTIIVLV